MRDSSVWRRLLGVENVIVEGVRLEQKDLVVEVRLYRRQRHRCGRCGQRSPRYDAGEGRRRWRALDLGTTRAFVEAEAPRVSCPRHGVVVAQVPWADHNARFTRPFEEQIAWLSVECSKTAVTALMRIAWRSIGPLLVRVTRRLLQGTDRLEGLRRIGIETVASNCTSSKTCWRSRLDPRRMLDHLATVLLDVGRERDAMASARRPPGRQPTAADPPMNHTLAYSQTGGNFWDGQFVGRFVVVG